MAEAALTVLGCAITLLLTPEEEAFDVNILRPLIRAGASLENILFGYDDQCRALDRPSGVDVWHVLAESGCHVEFLLILKIVCEEGGFHQYSSSFRKIVSSEHYSSSAVFPKWGELLLLAAGAIFTSALSKDMEDSFLYYNKDYIEAQVQIPDS